MGVAASTGMRFFTTGEKLVKKTFDDLGNSGRKMWAGVASGKDRAVPGMAALSNAVNEAKGGVDGLIGTAGPAGRIISGLGAGGVAAAAGIGAMVLAFHQSLKAMEDFSSIGEAAAKVATTTDNLQELRFVVEQTGGTAEEADASMKQFMDNFGLARAGNARSLKWFQALGFSREDLQQFKAWEDVFPEVSRRIAALGNTAEQNGIAEKLGLSAFIPAIREGAGAIDEMRAKAREMGIVIDATMIKRAKESEDKFKAVSKVIDVQLKQAFVSLAPTLIDVLGTIAEIARWFGRIVDSARSLNNMTSEGLNRKLTDISQKQVALMKQYGILELVKPAGKPTTISNVGSGNPLAVDFTGRGPTSTVYSPIDQARLDYQRMRKEGQAIRDELAKREGENAPPAPTGEGSLDVTTDTKAKLASFYTALQSAHDRALKASETEATSIEARVEIERQRLAQEKTARAAELANKVKAGDFTQAQADQLAAAEQAARDAEMRKIEEAARRDREKANAEIDKQAADAALDILRSQESLAITAKQRLALQLVILEAERKVARDALERQLKENPNLSEDQRNAALGAFDAQTAAMRKGAMVDAGADWKQTTRRATYESLHDAIHDAFEGNRDFLSAFFGGLAERFASKLEDELTDNIFDVLDGVISDVFKELPGSADGAGGAGGSGGLLSSMISFGSDMLGFAPGTGAPGVGPGVAFRAAEQGTEMMLIGQSGRIFDSDATARELSKTLGSSAGSSPVIHTTYSPTYNFRGTAEEIAAVNRRVDQDQRSFASRVHMAVNDGFDRKKIRNRWG